MLPSSRNTLSVTADNTDSRDHDPERQKKTRGLQHFKRCNPRVLAYDICVFLSTSGLAEIVQVSRSVFLKLAAAECVFRLHGGIFREFCYKSEVS